MSEQTENKQPVLDQEFLDKIDIALGSAEKPYSHDSTISGYPESVISFIKGEKVGTVDDNTNEFTVAQLKSGDRTLPAERVQILMEKLGVDVMKGIPVVDVDQVGGWPSKGDYQLKGAIFATNVSGLMMEYRFHGEVQDVVLTREKAA